MTRTDVFCRLLRWSGFLALRARQLRVQAGGRLTILAYHRVVERMPEDYPFDEEVLSCTRTEFEREMAFVREVFDVISFADLGGEGRPRGNPLIVTFDDGYKDNHDVALPVLEKLGLPATFFVTTGYIGSEQLPWWDEIAWVVKHARSSSLSVRAEGRTETLPVAGAERRKAATSFLLGLAKRVPDRERQALLGELRAQAPEPEGAQGLMMTWVDVRDLVARGMEIGSHTASHAILGRVESDEELASELRESKRRIEAETGRRVEAVSYPVGRASAVTDRVTRLTEEAGYRFGCVYEHGVNPIPLADRLRLRRVKAEVREDFHRFRAKALFPEWVRY